VTLPRKLKFFHCFTPNLLLLQQPLLHPTINLLALAYVCESPCDFVGLFNQLSSYMHLLLPTNLLMIMLDCMCTWTHTNLWTNVGALRSQMKLLLHNFFATKFKSYDEAWELVFKHFFVN
jgi:ABC-type multidrug transport system permease subunit